MTCQPGIRMTLVRLLYVPLLACLIASAAFALAPAQTVHGFFGQPRAEASDAERTIFTNGLRQFSRTWDEREGIGERFNERSCLGCHSVPAPGGSGIAPNTFVVVSNEIT